MTKEDKKKDAIKEFLRVSKRHKVSGNQGLVQFDECECQCDLNRYKDDLIKSGANVISGTINKDTRICLFNISVKDEYDFLQKFGKTKSVKFSSITEK